MSQVNSILRRVEGGYSHWCPGCEEMHVLPDTWKFNGNLEQPTFTPSFKHEGVQRLFKDGKWIGWKYDEAGNPLRFICHYILTDGILNFCGDCTHSLVNISVPIPPLPDGYTD